MKRLLAMLIISLVGCWPIVADAGEQSPEQPRLLNKEQIQLVQQRLVAEGFNPRPVNGELNAQTEAAIRQYQQKQGIPASGALDETNPAGIATLCLPGRSRWSVERVMMSGECRLDMQEHGGHHARYQ